MFIILFASNYHSVQEDGHFLSGLEKLMFIFFFVINYHSVQEDIWVYGSFAALGWMLELYAIVLAFFLN